MRIYNGAGSDLAFSPPLFPPDSYSLKVVLNHQDASGVPDLHSMFLLFASTVFQSADITNPAPIFRYTGTSYPPITSGLCRMIYFGWLRYFVSSTTTGGGGVPKSTVSTYTSTVTNKASFLSLLQTVLAAQPASQLYTLLGMYHFVIWYLSTMTGIFGEIDVNVLAYIEQELLKHTYSIASPPDTVVWTVTAFPLLLRKAFAAAFKPSNSLRQFEFSMRGLLNYLKLQTSGWLLQSYNNAGTTNNQQLATRAALCDFISEARRLLNTAINSETRSLLGAVDSNLASAFNDTRVLALGLGDITYGFFGIHNLGILFFDYILSGQPSTIPFDLDGTSRDSLDYLGIEVNATDSWTGENASSVFVAHVGVDQPFDGIFSTTTDSQDLNALIPHVAAARSTATSTRHDNLYVVLNGRSRLKPAGLASIYDPRASSIAVAANENLGLEFWTNTNIRLDKATPSTPPNLVEEIAFFVMPNKVPTIPPSAIAKTQWLLPDNEFYSKSQLSSLFLDLSGGTSIEFNNLLSLLSTAGDFEVVASLRGEGIGMAADAGTGGTANIVVKKASVQKDGKGSRGEDSRARHARGSVSYSEAGDYRLLAFEVVGFTDERRCTWAKPGKYPYGSTLYNNMFAAVGMFITDLDDGKPPGPWYNGALSSCRAFGLLKGMIEVIKSKVSGNVAATLDAYLSQQAGVRIPRLAVNDWVKANGKELIITNATFSAITPP